MKSQVSVVTSFTSELPDSLETLQCRQNKPLYVFPYGEKVRRNSLTQVNPKFKSGAQELKSETTLRRLCHKF
jgi:hypothetical protein